ncbi:unnamed protein product [Adineta steineri]|uniref:NAD(P)(+)--arginine ADP-ribosyltransferase n=1 Tax=Adineta steineri TaxID=433720 RepID=A0A813MCW2_9BILA|nr:unnamed protein product [Adineta steineri]CAF4159912.1 unnamed protein product [Adineta steineri]
MNGSESNQHVAASSESTASSNTRQPHQRVAQKYLLLWADTSIDQTNEDYENTLKQIRTITDDVNVFTQRDACIDFLTNAQEDIKYFLVLKDTMSQQIMPLINDIPQLDGIYIFNDIDILHEQWAKKFDKIKSIHTNIDDLCQALPIGIKQSNQDSIAMSFITVEEMASTDNLNQLEPTFMYTQLFKEILLDMKHNEQAIKQFIAYCRHHDCGAAKTIEEFEKNYQSQSAIWWYTSPSFIYSMLNYALRCMEGDAIINMGFFIHDLHQQIQQLYQQQVNSYHSKPFLVYRGQALMKLDLEKLQKTKGGLISFNNFLSTSTDKGVSLGYAECASTNPDTVGILFIMSINPCLESTPYASVKELSYFKVEEEILFSMHSIFRVVAIKQMDNQNQLYEVQLQLTSDDDQHLRLLTDRIREEASGGTGWQRLGDLLLRIGQFNEAEELYNVLLEETPDEGEKLIYHNQRGLVRCNQGDYETAISYYEKALAVLQKYLPSDHPSLTASYNNIGSVYDKTGEYSKALSYYEKALEICQKTLPSNHHSLATLYNNIGSVYDKIGEYSKALSFFEKALEIRQKTLPSNHPRLATSYNNIGLVYNHMGQFSRALSYYEKALEIRQKTLPSNHHSSATSYNNIGNVYEKMGEYSKALSSHEKALEICQKTLPSHHPSLAATYTNIGSVYDERGEYSKALSYYEKALEIYQRTLPSNHHSLATLYNNIGHVYDKMGEYSKALSSHEKALEIRQKTLPSNHPDFAQSYNNIGIVYDKIGEYSKALSYYEKALEIREKTLASNHPSLATSYNNIGNVYIKTGEYSKGLSSHEKALEICQKTLPPNHPDLAQSYNNVGSVHYKTGEYSKALSFYEKALGIQEKTLPSNHPDLAQSYNNIGSVCNKTGEYSKALSYYEKALEICQKTLPSNHPSVATLYNNIGGAYTNMKDYSKALSYFERALNIIQSALPLTHPYIKIVKESIEIVKKKL